MHAALLCYGRRVTDAVWNLVGARTLKRLAACQSLTACALAELPSSSWRVVSHPDRRLRILLSLPHACLLSRPKDSRLASVLTAWASPARCCSTATWWPDSHAHGDWLRSILRPPSETCRHLGVENSTVGIARGWLPKVPPRVNVPLSGACPLLICCRSYGSKGFPTATRQNNCYCNPLPPPARDLAER